MRLPISSSSTALFARSRRIGLASLEQQRLAGSGEFKPVALKRALIVKGACTGRRKFYLRVSRMGRLFAVWVEELKSR